jgi:hypothetical protein
MTDFQTTPLVIETLVSELVSTGKLTGYFTGSQWYKFKKKTGFHSQKKGRV